ncbi:hypothetical protein GA0061084_3201 [Arthrobacter sp. NIO-1057]|nr:hypothetical protein GA0061084_3201 [Arthrobacter sp. NIO-1057]
MGGGIGNFGAGDKGKLTLGCPLARSAYCHSRYRGQLYNLAGFIGQWYRGFGLRRFSGR